MLILALSGKLPTEAAEAPLLRTLSDGLAYGDADGCRVLSGNLATEAAKAPLLRVREARLTVTRKSALRLTVTLLVLTVTNRYETCKLTPANPIVRTRVRVSLEG